MTRHGGKYGHTIPMDADRATFEAFQARIEQRELARHLDRYDPDDRGEE